MNDEFYYGSIIIISIVGIAYAYYSHKYKIEHRFF